MNHAEAAAAIAAGETYLGIELGSTRIKAVLIGRDHAPLAAGSHAWENRYVDGLWTYALPDVWDGLQRCFSDLAKNVREAYGLPLCRVAAMGVSAMMHGYLVFDANDRLLTPFRTWRNTSTGAAAAQLSERFSFNIPQRWSVAHLYQAVLNGEPHVRDAAFLTTLAGYVHFSLTGERVLGVGDASGMFPIAADGRDYDARMLAAFDALLTEKAYPWTLRSLLPRVLQAGEPAGYLTEAGALRLDPSGTLLPGVPLCPPEGDAGTGMTATNSVAARTGNVSAGTSVFAMVVLDRPLENVYPEIDLVTTPTGKPVAMVHCNNCTGELDAWARLFGEALAAAGAPLEPDALYPLLYNAALEGETDCGGLLAFNYLSGEPVTQLSEGRPLFCRLPDSRLTLPNFMRAQLYAALATLRLGMELLLETEHVPLDRLYGHGGFFKTPGVGQRMLAAAAGVPVSVMETAGEGGAWGAALLSAYLLECAEGEPLEDYLARRVFSGNPGTELAPDPADRAGFSTYLSRYRAGLVIERAAVESLR